MLGGVLQIRNQQLVFGKQTFVMGIVNVTPDSFSQDGITDVDEAVKQALHKINKGAQIIDIGGQSTRPDYTPVDEKTELDRVIPVIKALRKVSDTIISVDTFSPLVLEKSLACGADILNSIWGLTNEFIDIIKRHPVPIVIMHNKSEALYPNGVMAEVLDYLAGAAEKALSLGLSREQIILDPGIGFGKTAEDNIEILTNFQRISSLSFPTLLGCSRKSTIGKLTGRPVDQRVFGTAATVALGIAYGVDIVRVHDVEEIADVVKVSDALVRRWRPADWTENLDGK